MAYWREREKLTSVYHRLSKVKARFEPTSKDSGESSLTRPKEFFCLSIQFRRVERKGSLGHVDNVLTSHTIRQKDVKRLCRGFSFVLKKLLTSIRIEPTFTRHKKNKNYSTTETKVNLMNTPYLRATRLLQWINKDTIGFECSKMMVLTQSWILFSCHKITRGHKSWKLTLARWKTNSSQA